MTAFQHLAGTATPGEGVEAEFDRYFAGGWQQYFVFRKLIRIRPPNPIYRSDCRRARFPA
jgi:hypothetical protein